MDLRSFGIPQRRERLFIVGHISDPRPAIRALLERTPTKEDCGSACKVEQGNMARTTGRTIDGWSGDETPKRGEGVCPTLRANQGGEGVGVIEGPGRLRKLMTVEWERLQGFPDSYTRVVYGKGMATKRQRERALGNAFPPPMLRWIGKGIAAEENRTSL